ncbi:tetrahydrofolate dehydrogenase/cyclohydrolase catalytic domain-containing protein [Natrinema sp. 1APR25-10V2]|uniref:bifunctional 5,10-methylenetetrahydrofolate dehydrogenase/5,10-methenyltetrahydrofolate cyclohydrolase n=1 Tax=Natrinema sp. 1APR25-10V2 TaxID=2951081 RepID=UPI002875CD99|nr:tetrahydrofolate dehydrogenase/cyclohydrolase catalytic domain-containing protein [Natrinema sp. 1APR25-10V2]MDS0476199.1 bifunctional 5,10-methylene-tetrahydrofolate dehydrogenase/5,10-methylene-tetrahydrofolate cyclohydrolase [Natrinema sp. 1APR25-10V2]
MSSELLLGDPVAMNIRNEVSDRVRQLRGQGLVPTLGTVLMSGDPADKRFMDLKHAACDDVGLATQDIRLDPAAPPKRLHRAVDRLCADPEVHAVFVQVPLPDHVAITDIRQRLEPRKDVDCFHPRNLGRLVAGDPVFVPATPAAVCRLLTAYDITVEGRDVVLVGRSDVIGKPLANLLLQDTPRGNATVTVCHSGTPDLASATRRADIVVTSCGVPELVDGSMLSSGVVVVDVSSNHRPVTATGKAQDGSGDRSSPDSVDGTATDVVGDVEFESAKQKASAITPVPGGVGPVTLAMLVRNVVHAAERRVADGIL